MHCTKSQILAKMIKEANKTEQAALYYGEQGMQSIERDLLKKAQELFLAANEYSLRWDVRWLKQRASRPFSFAYNISEC